MKRCGRFVQDYATFVSELPDSFSEIGAMLPSSAHLAKVMVEPLSSTSKPSRILEVGPGTGPITKTIVSLLKKNDELVVCEINSRFMRGLKNTLSSRDDFNRKKDQINFFEGSVIDLPVDLVGDGFDFIVSSLPFHNFTPEMVDVFFSYFNQILKEGGTLTFFHYAGLKKLSGISLKKQIRERVKGVDAVISKWCDQAEQGGEVGRKVSYLNLPPAVSVRLKMPCKSANRSF
ncbi:MAG TPA: methyltransferase domain-containing protein [Oligoflexia bacterium]|nr:methyltransferase domain-containing protein [Oligoflexia bacterium]